MVPSQNNWSSHQKDELKIRVKTQSLGKMGQDNAAKANYEEVIKLGLIHTSVQRWDKRTRPNMSE